MKANKLFLPTVILTVAIFVMAVYSVVSSVAKKPTITEQEFRFQIVYELDGETQTIQDIVKVRYDKTDGYTDTKTRFYVGQIGDMSEGTIYYVLKDEEDGRIELNTKLYPDYLMGDSTYDYFVYEDFAPQILYYDAEGYEYTDEETLLAHGVKLVSFDYPTPIENSFVFSHISNVNSGVILPTLLIGCVALLLIIILIKKDNDFVRKPINVVSTVLNFVVCFTILPYSAVAAWLLDAVGDNESALNQLFYFVPALTVLGVAASVALRRKGYGKSALVVGFTGPVVLVLILLIFSVLR